MSAETVAAGSLDGLWGSSLDLRGAMKIEATLDLAEGFGEFFIYYNLSNAGLQRIRSGEAQLPPGFSYSDSGTSTRCRYFLRLEEGAGVPEILLDAGRSGQNCARDASLAFEDTSDGLVAVYTAPNASSRMPLFRSVGPLPDDELAVLPAGFDILGVYPGMPLDEARSTLEARGYSVFEPANDPSIVAADWRQDAVIYTMGEVMGNPQWGNFPDKVTLIASTIADVMPFAEDSVLLISRIRKYGEAPTEGVTPDVLEKAITDKFGPLQFTQRSASAFWTKAGDRMPDNMGPARHNCTRDAQPIDYQMPFYEKGNFFIEHRFSAACGSTLYFSSKADGALVSEFTQVIFSQPVFVRDVWRRYAGQVAAKAMAEFERIGSQTSTKAPDL